MPRTPILDRESFFEQLPDGSLQPLGFNLVNTTLGAAFEPVTINRLGGSIPDGGDGRFEETVSRITVIDKSYPLLNEAVTGGLNTPRQW